MLKCLPLSGNLVSGQGFPQDSLWAGGFCHYAIMHTVGACGTPLGVD